MDDRRDQRRWERTVRPPVWLAPAPDPAALWQHAGHSGERFFVPGVRRFSVRRVHLPDQRQREAAGMDGAPGPGDLPAGLYPPAGRDQHDLVLVFPRAVDPGGGGSADHLDGWVYRGTALCPRDGRAGGDPGVSTQPRTWDLDGISESARFDLWIDL